MKSQAMQEFVKNIFGDERTRLQFQSDPDGVLSRFDLTAQEKQAVLSTQARVGLVTGNSPQLEAALSSNDPWFAPAP
ncbi:MAG: hypothetical protein HYX90_08655 [Chloroflexi bacterium]|nr:hypothetical protein [Chloroflexota bacterium]